MDTRWIKPESYIKPRKRHWIHAGNDWPLAFVIGLGIYLVI